jgi:hypothetical protein
VNKHKIKKWLWLLTAGVSLTLATVSRWDRDCSFSLKKSGSVTVGLQGGLQKGGGPYLALGYQVCDFVTKKEF